MSPQSAKERHFTSDIIEGHSCSALLMSCLYFLPPRHHPVFPNVYFDVAFLFLQRQTENLVLNAASQHGDQFLEYTTSVSLGNFIIYLFH